VFYWHCEEYAYVQGKVSLSVVSVDSTLVDSKKVGQFVEFDGHIDRKGVKVHAAVSLEGLPLGFLLSPGNEYDSQKFFEVMESLRIRIPRGRPRCRPNEVYADAAYDNRMII
jgi:hypothetical protein